MFAAATSFFARTNISANYNIGVPSSSSTLPGFGSGSRSSTPGPSASSSSAGGSSSPAPTSLPAPQLIPTFHVGPWRVQSATHKVTHKRVSVWTYDKKTSEADRLSVQAKEKVIEFLKTEVHALDTYTFVRYTDSSLPPPVGLFSS